MQVSVPDARAEIQKQPSSGYCEICRRRYTDFEIVALFFVIHCSIADQKPMFQHALTWIGPKCLTSLSGLINASVHVLNRSALSSVK